jgi:hypothetical protein
LLLSFWLWLGKNAEASFRYRSVVNLSQKEIAVSGKDDLLPSAITGCQNERPDYDRKPSDMRKTQESLGRARLLFLRGCCGFSLQPP